MSGRRSRPSVEPPRLAVRIVRATLPANGAAPHVADLEERFEARVRHQGEAAARRWFWRQAFGFVARVPAARLADRLPGRSGETDSAGNSCATMIDAEPVRSRRVRRTLSALGRDLSYSLRSLRSRPTFSVPAIAVLALAIGANTAVLSIVDNVLLRDLPIADADSVVLAWDLAPPGGRPDPRMPITYDHYQAWRARTDLFSQVAAMETAYNTLETDEYPIRPNGMLVSGSTFGLMGAEAALGRVIQPHDDEPGADNVVVLSDRMWRNWFGADPDIVGRVVTLDGDAVSVIGVMPADFWFFDPYMFARSIGDREETQPDLWRPLNSRDWRGDDSDYPALRVMARLQDGVSIESASTAARAMRAALATEEEDGDVSVALIPLTDEALGGVRPRLLLLQGAVTLLVLIACVNVMSLVLAKNSATRPELAVRAALGAGRAGLVRLAVSEAALLGIAGGTLGLLTARSLTGVILSIAPRELPLAHRVTIDARIAVMTLAVALAAGILAGLIPALGIDFRSLAGSLRSGSRSVTGTKAGSRARFALIAAEVALTVTLLIGATVVLRSFVGVWNADAGFERRGVLTLFTRLAQTGDAEPNFVFHRRLLDAIRGLPGVVSAGGTTHLPFSNWRNTLPVVIDDAVIVEAAPRVDARWITEGYLESMGIDLRAGRGIRASDEDTNEPVVLVNEAFAQHFLDVSAQGAGSLVGRTIGVVKYLSGGEEELIQRRIVGVVENVKTFRLFEVDRPLLYLPERQLPWMLRYVVRTEADPLALVPAIRRLAAQIDPQQALTEIYPLEALVGRSISEERFFAQILTAFGLLAFAIAAAGVYGTIAYSARLRLREIGIRIAYGARPSAVHRLIVGQGIRPVVLGTVAGCGGAALLVRGLESLLHGVSPLDVTSFAFATTSFIAVAVVAAIIPARRAASVDPIQVLRAD